MITEPQGEKNARPHWSKEIDSITKNLNRHPRILIASDFDGTLSPIVERPEEAVMAGKARDALAELAGLHPRVSLAFLSGRALKDLSDRVGMKGLVFAGNHGLEISDGVSDWVHPEVTATRPLLERLLADFESRFVGVPGVELEDKELSITLHYRRMNPDWLPILNATLGSIVLPEEIRRHEGKMVFEFRPAVDWNKGLAIRRIASQMTIPYDAVVFLGDDVTDEDAFRELGPTATTIHVGSPLSKSLARFNAGSPDNVAECLRAISSSLGVVSTAES